MISVIIPCYFKEEPYLNQTIDNVFKAAEGEVEVIVALNGYNQQVDSRAKVVLLEENMGERVAMNEAAKIAKGEFLLRIDGHCDFYTPGWDLKMADVTDEKTITVAILTAVYHSKAELNNKKMHAQARKEAWPDWKRLPGHWYGMCRLEENMEAKWEKLNTERKYPIIVPNMAFTGCGWLIPTEFYWGLGGAWEAMPKMGAIGEEFAIKAWLNGGKVQSRTDVVIGHIFGTGAYDTQGVNDALAMLKAQYGDRYEEIKAKFPDVNIVPLRESKQIVDRRTVTINRTDVTETKDKDGKIVMKLVEHFKYVWLDDGSESDLTEAQIRETYAPLATKVAEEKWLDNGTGVLIKVEPQKENDNEQTETTS